MASERLCHFPLGDHGTAYVERGEIYDFVAANGITGFATVAGDRHSFWAGLAAKSLPPKPFVPVGIAFVTGSISAPGIVEALEHALPKDHPLRSLYVGQGPGDHTPQPTLNLLIRHGVRSCFEYLQTGDIAKARALSNLICRRTFRSSTWEVTATRWFTLPANSSRRNLSAFPARSSPATVPTGDRSPIAPNFAPAFGKMVKRQNSRCRFSKATRNSRCDWCDAPIAVIMLSGLSALPQTNQEVSKCCEITASPQSRAV